MPRKPRSKPSRLPTIDDEIALLAARRDRVSAWLERRLAAGNCEEAEALRCLATLSQVSGRLAALLVQRAATTGAQELEEFFEEVARRAEELAASGAVPGLSSAHIVGDPAAGPADPAPGGSDSPPGRHP